jgi:hypothetical protein
MKSKNIRSCGPPQVMPGVLILSAERNIRCPHFKEGVNPGSFLVMGGRMAAVTHARHSALC